MEKRFQPQTACGSPSANRRLGLLAKLACLWRITISPETGLDEGQNRLTIASRNPPIGPDGPRLVGAVEGLAVTAWPNSVFRIELKEGSVQARYTSVLGATLGAAK
jgi:hypothetical protein